MYERFTDRARRTIVLAQEESRDLCHHYLGTEHLLLGLIREDGGVAAEALKSLGISLEVVRDRVEEIIGQGQDAPTGHLPFTPRLNKVLELSYREALQLKNNYIGTEHLLLGLLREGEGVGAQVLETLGADLHKVRQSVVQVLASRNMPVPMGANVPLSPSQASDMVELTLRVPREIAHLYGSEGTVDDPHADTLLARWLLTRTLKR